MKRPLHPASGHSVQKTLQNFTSSSDIDWPRLIAETNEQLDDKYDLSNPERAFIESMIKPMA